MLLTLENKLQDRKRAGAQVVLMEKAKGGQGGALSYEALKKKLINIGGQLWHRSKGACTSCLVVGPNTCR